MKAPAVTRKVSSPPRAALTLIEASLPADPFLLTDFESFYEEIVELKARLEARSPQVLLSLEDVHQQLRSLLLEQENKAFQTGALLGVEMHRQAQRVMACLADEIFSAAPSPAATSWRSLEMELFEDEKAWGLALEGPCMKKLNLLLQVDDPAYRELAAVYFYALALNESGQYERKKLLPPLFEMISGKAGETAEDDRIFAQSYAHTLAENRVTVLPSSSVWWLTLVVIILFWLAVSSLLWIEVSEPVEQQIQSLPRK